MSIGLVFFPHIILRGTLGSNVNPTLLGILRGAGGSILPYSLLYFMTARRPFKLIWAFYIIALANIIAIILDFSSVIMDEYKFSNAMIDVPFEVISLIGILLFWKNFRFIKKEEEKSD
jgi:hypothetical protein